MANEFPKNKIEIPTVGHIVHVFGTCFPGTTKDTPHAAIVAGVVDELEINVACLSHTGDVLLGAVQHVPHISEKSGDAVVWWDWMPYQKSQAAKTEALQAELDKLASTKP